MNTRTIRRWAAGAAMIAMSFSVSAQAQTAEADQDASLRTEVEQLRERLARLEQLLTEKSASAEAAQTGPAAAPATEQDSIDAAYAEGRTLVLPSAPTQAQ